MNDNIQSAPLKAVQGFINVFLGVADSVYAQRGFLWLIRLYGMTEATSWRGEAALWYRVAGHQSAHFHSRRIGTAWRGAGRGYSATWPLGLVTRGQSNLMSVHWGEREKENKWRGKGAVENITSPCVRCLDHGNSQICSASRPALSSLFHLVKRGLRKRLFSGLSTCGVCP